MKNKENEYYIYIRSTSEKVPATKEEFDLYYRDINSYRVRQQRHGKCVCPKSKRFSCDMDCWTCPFRRGGDSVSLDYENSENDDANHEIYTLQDDAPVIEDAFEEIDEIKRLFAKLCELLPEAEIIGNMRADGNTFSTISEKIGIKNSTLSMRIKAVKKILSEEFPDFFEML